MNTPELPRDIGLVVELALREDVGAGDITAELIPASRQGDAVIESREDGILCGIPWAGEVFRQLDKAVTLHWYCKDGDRIRAGDKLARIRGRARSILTGERTALNFLQTLSGTATLARRYADLVAHSPVILLDTRKTLPALRSAQKFAVAVGGCRNHRMGLFDAYLIKENHIAACGGIDAAVRLARAKRPDRPLEIEVRHPGQLPAAIAAGADRVLLDNFSVADLRAAVAANAGRVKLEASGGVDENTLVSIAGTGVDYVSIGALTKNCRALDLSLLMQPSGGTGPIYRGQP